MNKLLKLAASIFMVVALCFAFTLDNAVSAATSNKTSRTSAQDRAAMRAFRESVLATVNDNNQIFHQFFIFMVPDLQSELEFNGKITGHSLNIAGNFGLWLTGNTGEVIDTDVPFYVTQNDSEMAIYYRTDNQWTKYVVPTVAANVADVVASPTSSELNKQLEMVKEVTILQDNDSRRTLLVRLDGAKLADELQIQAASNPADNGTANDVELHDGFLKYLDTGLRNADIWYTWKIDKKNKKTGAISFDLSPIIQETARAALDDKTQDFPDVIREMLEMLAYYSEFRAYTTLLGPEAMSTLTVPQEVIDTAKVADDIVPEDKIPAAVK